MEDSSNTTGWVKLYHPAGAQVTFPVDLNVLVTPDQATTMLQSVTNLLNAGFSVFQPGLEDGEQMDQIGFVVRKEKEGEGGEITPVIDLYPANGNFRLLHIYLNTPADVQAFEKATGVKLEKLPIYEGTNAIERGQSAKVDRFVVKLSSPVKVVWKLNPRYDPDETDIKKKKPRRLFVRWADAPAAPAEGSDDRSELEKAGDVLTPGGAMLRTLNVEQLRQLAASQSPKVTDEMRKAANLILETPQKESLQ